FTPAIACAIAAFRLSGVLPILCAAAAIWIIASTITDVVERVRLFRAPFATSVQRARMLPRAIIGTAIAHIGVGITVLGLSAMSQAQHKIVEVPIGTTEHLAGYDWTLTNVKQEPGPNYTAMMGTLEVRRNGHLITVMHPSKRSFNTQNQTTTDVAIHTNLLADLYGVLGDKHGPDNNPTYVLRLHYNPLAPWMWLGALVMAFGGALSLSDRRVRVGAPQRAKSSAEMSAAS
ncbi:cytochrome c-type biogenesis CcmF C-terminal domain-containing protein, partial [Acetobacter pasteurianus]|uniref:cytochrome c-type biogenesis CcmF C-terminal domain-containing protein n=1 Tax=Acetobacter pasteurianus TaxID=438 RepID=UPI0005518A86